MASYYISLWTLSIPFRSKSAVEKRASCSRSQQNLTPPRKTDYSYPTIRLPHTLSVLSGLPTQIYQTVHDGVLAFLVVISCETATSAGEPKEEEKALESPESSAFTRQRSPVRIRPSALLTIFLEFRRSTGLRSDTSCRSKVQFNSESNKAPIVTFQQFHRVIIRGHQTLFFFPMLRATCYASSKSGVPRC